MPAISIEGISQAELNSENIKTIGIICVGFGNQIIADVSQSVKRPALGIGGTGDQRLRGRQTLAYAPVLVQQIAKIQKIHPELQGIASFQNIAEQILRNAEISPVNHGQGNATALGVLAAVVLQIWILLDKSFPRGYLLCDRERSRGGTGANSELFEIHFRSVTGNIN